MKFLTERIDRIIEGYKGYVANMLKVDMSKADIHRRITHQQRIDDYREMIKHLEGIKTQLQYHPVS